MCTCGGRSHGVHKVVSYPSELKLWTVLSHQQCFLETESVPSACMLAVNHGNSITLAQYFCV